MCTYDARGCLNLRTPTTDAKNGQFLMFCSLKGNTVTMSYALNKEITRFYIRVITVAVSLYKYYVYCFDSQRFDVWLFQIILTWPLKSCISRGKVILLFFSILLSGHVFSFLFFFIGSPQQTINFRINYIT